MIYFKNWDEKIKEEENINYFFTAFNRESEFLFGVPKNIHTNDFSKIEDLQEILDENEKNTKELAVANHHTSSVRIRFLTNSNKIFIRCQLDRAWAYVKMSLYNSHGFDVYQKADNWEHRSVIAPKQGDSFFWEEISIVPNQVTEIYFPNYTRIFNLQIGIPKEYEVSNAPNYTIAKPIVFYGNSMTQGASASRSGTSVPNLVSRKLDANIMNFSFSGACKGERNMAKKIAQTDMSACVIDYTRNATSVSEFNKRYPVFYEIIRQSHPQIPIILCGAFRMPQEFEKIIVEFYKQKVQEDRNLYYISQDDLLSEKEMLALSFDRVHYCDLGMYRMANKIVNVLKYKI